MSSSVFRSRKAQSRANAPHDQLLDPLLGEEDRRAAMRNGTYIGEDGSEDIAKVGVDQIVFIIWHVLMNRSPISDSNIAMQWPSQAQHMA